MGFGRLMIQHRCGIGSVRLIKGVKRRVETLREVSIEDLRFNMGRYSEFPKFQMPSNLLNSISQNIPLFMLSLLFSPAVAGIYSLTYRAMQTPTLLISSATRSVFYQKASKIYSRGGEILPHIYILQLLGLYKRLILPLPISFIN